MSLLAVGSWYVQKRLLDALSFSGDMDSMDATSRSTILHHACMHHAHAYPEILTELRVMICMRLHDPFAWQTEAG